MGLKVPVIGTAVEGLPLTLGAGRGVIVPPEDPGALAAAIADVLAGRRTTDLVGARDYALRFSPERVAAHYASAYRSLAIQADRPKRHSMPPRRVYASSPVRNRIATSGLVRKGMIDAR